VVKVQQCEVLKNEVMNMTSWIVSKWNHCY